jgi:hypothetical protein
MPLPINQPNTQPDPAGDLAFLHEAIVKPQQDNQVVKKLAIRIGKVWDQLQKENKENRKKMVDLCRRVKGEYDPVKLAAIRAFKGSEAYIRSGEAKARAADSWIKDIYRGDTDLPWNLEPTAVPELPDETRQIIQQQTQQQAAQIEQEIIASGVMPDPNEVAKLMQEYYEQELDKAQEDLLEDAKERCKRASDVIRDQNQEGGWNDAFKEFLYYFIRLKAGVIKGPILTKKKKQTWQPNEATGGYELTTIDTLVNDVYCVSPFNFFPSRGMKSINDGDVVEIHELSKQAISDLIGVPGYSEEEIRLVLDKYGKGDLKAKWFTIEDETAVRQVTKDFSATQNTTPPTSNSSDLNSDTIFAQEFYGSVSGQLLLDWGAEGELDPHMQYQANCWKIGDHVIKAVINPDTLGRKPYHVSSWAKNPESIWGEGLLEFAAPLEDAMNALMRALINNAAIASGPMVEEDKDRIEENTPIYPWRKIRSTSMQMKNDGPAVNYYQPQMHLQELISAWQFLSKVLDEMTVPAYAQGASQSGVTAGTATVFTQLLAAASRSIKAVVANIDDDIITPYIQMCYDFQMKFSDDPSIKGDARVVAKGVSGLLAREQQSHQKIELLQMVANPAYMQILGAKNIGALLAQIIKGQDIKLPDLDRLDGSLDAEAQIQQILMSQAGVQQQEADPNQMNGQSANGGGGVQQAQGANPDGSKAGVNLA